MFNPEENGTRLIAVRERGHRGRKEGRKMMKGRKEGKKEIVNPFPFLSQFPLSSLPPLSPPLPSFLPSFSPPSLLFPSPQENCAGNQRGNEKTDSRWKTGGRMLT